MTFFTLFSCGQGKFPDYEPSEQRIEISNEHQYFKGNFVALNRRHSTLRRADSLLWLKLNQFYVKIVFWGRGQQRYHQFIHSGERCPDSNSDLNRDGIIDFHEALLASGEILVPLDRNLQSKKEGSEWYPISSKEGSYLYSRSSSLLKMLPDLGFSSVDSLDLSNRVIIIYSSNVRSMLPVACAEIDFEN